MERPKVGLALGGGGARGLAHIGILKVLQQEHIPIDLLSGASMGGILAAAYGAGLSPEQMEAVALEASKPRKLFRLLDVNPRRRGLLEGKQVRKFLIEKLGLDIQFDNFRIPVALTATDYLRGETVILQHGSVIDAVMATSAFPGVFQSVKIDDRWLVDGGMLNNVPVNVVRDMGAQITIAVDVIAQNPQLTIPNEPEQIHRLPSLFPRMTEDLYQSAMIMTYEITRFRFHECPPDLIIYPDIPTNLSIFLGFTRAAEVIQAGEEAARRALPEIYQLLEKNFHSC